MIKVVHYINQFYAGIGGEEKADYPAEIRVGEFVGPGLALSQAFGEEAEIVMVGEFADFDFASTFGPEGFIYQSWADRSAAKG